MPCLGSAIAVVAVRIKAAEAPNWRSDVKNSDFILATIPLISVSVEGEPKEGS